MRRSVCVLALWMLLLAPGLASANCWGWRWNTSYYYAPSYRVVYQPVYVMPAAPVCVEAPPPRTFAQPVPAGPSGSPAPGPRSSEPPLSTPKPGVTESRSFFDAYAVAPRSADKPAAGKVSVGFWNLTDRDLMLHVDQRTFTVLRGKSVRLELERQFAWRVEARAAQNEQVPAGEAGREIVIRR